MRKGKARVKLARGNIAKRGINLRLKNNTHRGAAIGIFLTAALIVLLLLQVSLKLALLFVAMAILAPVVGMIYFFKRLEK
jgi:hypothetical protein